MSTNEQPPLAPPGDGPPVPPLRPQALSPFARGVALAVLAVLVAYIGVQCRALWREYWSLRHDLFRVRRSTVIGYININLNPSYARKPKDWYHDEGDSTLLWSGWRSGVGHRWFRIARGELRPSDISVPLGRDVVQAIDRPIVEVGGGTRWARLPWDESVAGAVLADVPCAYPLLLLRKVEVVNDTVGDRPFLVAYSPFAPEPQRINVYDPVIDGRRLTFGSSGYFSMTRRPLLYDRATESLWLEEADEVRAVAGALKGSRLRRVAHLDPTRWGTWRGEHPSSRLIVGADRSRGLPRE